MSFLLSQPLLIVFLIPLLGVIILLFIPAWNVSLLRTIALNISISNFLLSLILWIQFDNSATKFQFLENYTSKKALNILRTSLHEVQGLNLSNKAFSFCEQNETTLAFKDALYVPAISTDTTTANLTDVHANIANQNFWSQGDLLFVTENASALNIYNEKYDTFSNSLNAITTSSISPFHSVCKASNDIYNDYSFSTLNFIIGIDGISLFFIILTTFLITVCILVSWNSIHTYVKEYYIAFLILESLMIAVFSVLDVLVFYIFFESVLIPMFIIIGVWGARERKIKAAYQFFLYTLFGSVLMLLAILLIYFQTGTTDLQILYSTHFSETRQILLWCAFFASFAVKVPMVPVHIWLPEAHVEAPTAGSVILAGILLKLGTYGFLRFSIPMFPYASLYFTPLIYTMSVIAIIYTSLTTLRQIDLKKIIAYSSVAHMNFVTLGLFSLNAQGIEGSILLMISHGLISPALFLCVGVLYDRHKTRILRYYAGCGRTMPLFALFFLFFTMANISLPGTSSFIGEFLLLTGAFQNNTFIATMAATGMVLGAAYALWLCNRVIYGIAKPYYISAFSDINRREFFMFLPFVFAILWMGIYPEPFLESIHCSVANLIQQGCC